MEKIKLKIMPVSDEIGKSVPYPSYATDGSAAMDLYACTGSDIALLPLEKKLIPTGIAIEIPDSGYMALVCARSGLGVKHGVTLSNGVGVIDSDYRGELMVGLINLSDTPYTIKKGDRIAQLIVLPIAKCQVEICERLSDTPRGTGGFGSTGR